MSITLLGLVIVAFAIGVILLLATQVVLPLRDGTPLFPLLRKATPLHAAVDDAEKELEEQTELVRLKEQLDKINRRKAELESKE